MLQKLLDEIRAGGTLETGVLAARLGTTPRMIAVMLDDLERLGMLETLAACNSQGCEGCDLSTACSPGKGRGRVWQLINSSPQPYYQRERGKGAKTIGEFE